MTPDSTSPPAPPPGEEDLSGQVLNGKYRLGACLGRGGFGAVYEATHLLARADRAVKVIHRNRQADPASYRLFLNEARAVMRLDTPRAVLVHDVDTSQDGRLFIVMELLRGRSLRDHLRNHLRSRLPVAEAVRLATQVCEALQAAHARGVIHRDLKPGNVMLVPGPGGGLDAKVVDFGIARLYSLTNTGETSTELHLGSTGTPPYMSLEQCRGLDVDGRSDLYSLGVMLYEMLAGRTPFRSNTDQGYLIAHVTETPRPPSTVCPAAGIPPDLDRLVLSLLAKSPADRFRDAATVATALKALSAPRARPRTLPLIVGAAVAAMAGLTAAWWLWVRGSPRHLSQPVPALSLPQESSARDSGPTTPSQDLPGPASARDAALDSTSPFPTPAVAPAAHSPRAASAAPGPRPPPTRPPSTGRPTGTRAEPPGRTARPAASPAPPGPAPRAPATSPPPRPSRAPALETPRPRGHEDPWDAAFDELEREIRKQRRR